MHPRRIRTVCLAIVAITPAAIAAPPIGPVAEPPRVSEAETIGGLDAESRPLGDQESLTTASPHESRVLAGNGEAPGIGASRTLGALVGVVGVMLVLFMGFRRLAARRGGLIASLGAAGRAPSGLVEVLARYPVARTQRIVVFRIGARVVVACQSAGARGGGGGMATLTEITDPEEVAALLRTVRDMDGTSSTAAFRSALQQAERDPATASPADAGMTYRSPEGDTVQWRDERIQIPAARPAAERVDPSIGRMRARLAAMRAQGDAA